jgi:hypothetical protein
MYVMDLVRNSHKGITDNEAGWGFFVSVIVAAVFIVSAVRPSDFERAR